MCESPEVAEESATGAPEIEIEMTPNMIEVGVIELARYNEDYERQRDAVVS
jgi:hypothetical protein